MPPNWPCWAPGSANPKPATGGAERESIAHAVLHAPSVFRSLKRAVTAPDYEALALDFKGVGKVRAEATNWNAVTLFVAPEGGGQVSDVLAANLFAYFEDKRPISTVIEIEDVDYVQIYVTAEMGVKNYYASEDVEEQVQQAAGRLLAFDHVDFGQTIYLSKFYEAIEAIDGVAFVNISEFRREGEASQTRWRRRARSSCAPTRSPLSPLTTRRMPAASGCCLEREVD